jgi:putative adenylate-forming enzyme
MNRLLILSTYLKFKFKPAFKNRTALEKWQHEQVVNYLKKVVPQSVFYSKKFKDLSFDNWQNFPTIDKAIMMENFDELNTRGVKKEEAFKLALSSEMDRDFSKAYGDDITVGISSGTSGNRGLALVTTDESAFWAGYVLYKILPNFITKKQKIAFFLRANSRLYETVKSRSIEFSYFDLLDSLQSHIDRLALLQPTILIAPPSMLCEIARFCENKKLTIAPKKIISVAEVLDPMDEQYLQQQFKQKIHQVYQCTEGFLAATCVHGTLHLNEDALVIQKEYLDDTKTKFMPIITDFHRITQPIIRYKLNDILTEKKTPCACGSTFTALEYIEGRMDDMFVFPSSIDTQDVLIFPDFFRRAVIVSSDKILSYKIFQINRSLVEIYLDCPQELLLIISESITQHLALIFDKMKVNHPQLKFNLGIPKSSDPTVKVKRVERQFKI